MLGRIGHGAGRGNALCGNFEDSFRLVGCARTGRPIEVQAVRGQITSSDALGRSGGMPLFHAPKSRYNLSETL